MTHNPSISRKSRGSRAGLQSRIYITVALLCLWSLTMGWGHAQSTGAGTLPELSWIPKARWLWAPKSPSPTP